jgi:methylated-DNA-[protein]-cysteine S-methyltransferase
LARLAGNPKAVRAAGGAMANNPLPLVIPCHRVLRSDGSIGGFSSPSGIIDKQRMLRLEGIVPTHAQSMWYKEAV